MNRNRFLYTMLATIGVGALLSYLVACRPSWHPDGTKVLFSYGNAEKGPSGIAMLDRTTGKTRSVFVTPLPALCWSQWKRDADQFLATWMRLDDQPKALNVSLLSLESAKPLRVFSVPIKSAEETLIGIPLAEVGGAVFMSGESLIRLDLKTGDVKRRTMADKRQISVIGHRDVLYYAMLHLENKGAELGTVNTADLSLQPVSRLEAAEVGKIAPLVLADMSLDGSVMVVPSRQDDKLQLLMLSGCKVQKIIPLSLDAKAYAFGNLQLSRDNKTVYAAVMPNEDGVDDEDLEDFPFGDAVEIKDVEPGQLGVAEIKLASGKLRLTPIAAECGEAIDWQIALSPDGKTLAVGGGMTTNDPQGPPELPLHLVDLTDAERKVTRHTAQNRY